MPVWARYALESRTMFLEIINLFGTILSVEKTPLPAAQTTVLGVLVTVSDDDVTLSIPSKRHALSSGTLNSPSYAPNHMVLDS
eukprot:13290643-Heterocapsa_arctica.AAC.1